MVDAAYERFQSVDEGLIADVEVEDGRLSAVVGKRRADVGALERGNGE